MALKVYGLPFSTCTARVLACLNEKGLTYELVNVNLQAGEHKKPHFLSKNPFGQIPAFEDDDVTLFESRAINAYVCHKFKDTGYDLIRHKNIKEAGRVGVWMEVESQQFSPANISTVFYQLNIAPMYGKPTDKAVVSAGAEKLGKVLDIYEARLSTTEYLAGDFFSLADLNHFPYAYYVMKTEWASLFTSRPHVKAWWENIVSRPSIQKVTEKMTLPS